jgi:hypothetical protein
VGFKEDMEQLKRIMKQLEIEYEQWFSGATPKPPVDTRKRVEELIRKYSISMPQNLGDAAVFQMHQSKYNSYAEMWNRKIRQKEEGRLPGQRDTVRPVGGEPPRPEREPAAGTDKLRDVFDQFVAARQKTGQGAGGMSYEAFRQKLEQQADQLRAKGGYREVDFGVSIKDGKVSIVAKPKK